MQNRMVTYIIIGILLLSAVVLIPTRSVEVIEETTKVVTKPVITTESKELSETYTISEMLPYRFETRVAANADVAGTGTQYVSWDITIKNFENITGCWDYGYTVYKNGQKHDTGTLKSLCVANKTEKVFSTPLYDMGNIKTDGAINYSAILKPAKIPMRNLTISGVRNGLDSVEKTIYQNVTEKVNETKIKRVNWLLGFTVFSQIKA